MANISKKTDSYTRSSAAGRRLYLALKVKGISRTKRGLFSDEEWIKRNLPKTAKSLAAWFEDGIPIYSKGKDIRAINAVAEYFRVDLKYFADDKEISDEDFLNKIVLTPTASELGGKKSAPDKQTGFSPELPLSSLETGKTVQREAAEFSHALNQIFRSHQDKGKQFEFFNTLLLRKIHSDISNFAESDFIEVSNIHQMPLLWNECHNHIEKTLLITSYSAVDQWVNHPNSRRAFEKEARLISQGVHIQRIYIYDTPEELQLLLNSENILFQIKENIELRFICHRDIHNFYYIKDIIASIEVIDAGLVDDSWLVLVYLDRGRNPIKLKVCWNLNKVKEYRIFLDELWHISYPAEKISLP
jgi:hypothetical protein